MARLVPGDTLGILGGGQLARMLVLAAARLGLRCHVFAPEADSPAFQVCAAQTLAQYSDEAALAAFAERVGLVTYEFENVPAATAAFLSERVAVVPAPRALAVTQDRLAEKNFIREIGLATPAFRPVADVASLEAALAEMGRPSVLKTRRFGYDGKGQVMIGPEHEASEAFAALGRAPSILEAFVPFEREISVIAARAGNGEIAAYDVCENAHRDHILAQTRVPARIEASSAHAAIEHAARIAAALDYVGILTVEMFVLRDEERERILINEIAPRVHNSGHWTIDGATTSQFEQHVRAVAGWPLGSPRRLGRIEMGNLIGEEVLQWPRLAAENGVHLHLYGKSETRPGRKMGHWTRVLAEEG